jgi:Transposase IS200 like
MWSSDELPVLDVDMLRSCRDAMRKVRGDLGATLREFNREDDHVHLVQYPLKVAVPALVNSLKGGVGAADGIRVHRPGEPAHHARALPVAVLLRRVLR